MKKQNIFLFFISLFVFVCTFSQEEVKKDSLVQKDVYGLRIGLDLSNPIRSIIDSDRKSIEIVADYRINKKWYAATEIGYLDNYKEEDNFDFSTKGQYIKLGGNYNTYNNWLNMDNEIYIGARYGFSTFSQTIENYTIFTDNAVPETVNNITQEFTGLNAHWMEFVIGLKAEVFENIYLGFSLSGKKMIATKEPENFKNLYAPGFNRVFLNDAGFGFNYTISYRIPFYKVKRKREKKEKGTEKKDE